ncbi:MAG: hypothetical protein ACYCPW_02975 [Nitrososphaerales archaeon]
MISVREFVEDLKKQGYSVEFDAQIKGTSGQTHRVDGLAKHHGEKMVVWLEKRGDTTTEMIQTFAIAYDTGAEACYVVDREPGREERKLAEFYKMRLLAKVQ